jgi:hypothetical protein
MLARAQELLGGPSACSPSEAGPVALAAAPAEGAPRAGPALRAALSPVEEADCGAGPGPGLAASSPATAAPEPRGSAAGLEGAAAGEPGRPASRGAMAGRAPRQGLEVGVGDLADRQPGAAGDGPSPNSMSLLRFHCLACAAPRSSLPPFYLYAEHC